MPIAPADLDGAPVSALHDYAEPPDARSLVCVLLTRFTGARTP